MSWHHQQHGQPPQGSYYGRPPPASYSQPPPGGYTPASYTQAPPGSYSRPPHQGGYSQTPPGGYSQPPPPTSSYGGYQHQPPPPTTSLGSYQQQQPPAGSLPPSQTSFDQSVAAPRPGQSATPAAYNPGYSLPGSGYGSGASGGGYAHPPPPARKPSGPPPGLDHTLWEWFQAVDANKSGSITAVELREALLNSNWSNFNEETCRLLIGMFDKDGNGTIDVTEFGHLWQYVQEWKGCFDKFDTDRSGNISPDELSQALLTFGYRLSMDFCQMCTRVFDRKDKNSMKFDDFIQCCVMLKSLTEKFKSIDTDQDGIVDVSYEQFLEMAIDNTIN